MDKYRNNPRKKRWGYKILAIVSLILIVAAVLSLGLLAYKGSFKDLFGERNKNNLIEKDSSYVVSLDTNRGVDVKVNDNGVIKLSGKATSAYDLRVTSVKLPAGTYTISSGMKDPNVDECWLYVEYSTGMAIADTLTATFTLTQEETVVVHFAWNDECNFNIFSENVVRPVIVEGKDVGEFYK